MSSPTIPAAVSDPVNARVLAVSEDRVQGFHAEPFQEIARLAELDLELVLERIRAMLAAGTIRRVRQTLLSINLAAGALVAWQVPEDKLAAAFDFMYQQDPFTGHVVLRSTDATDAGAAYRLWTTLKVPRGFRVDRHCEFLVRRTGALRYRLMPAKRVFVLGVGHTRRQTIEPGARTEVLAQAMEPEAVELSDLDWLVLTALKREFALQEVRDHPWVARAAEAGVSIEEFCRVAQSLAARGVLGRFSTFLEHVKPTADGQRVTRFNALFHWAVPPGREIEAGRQIGRHLILTHLYWRDAGPEFHNVNIMGVVHGSDRALVLAHKAAIDAHLVEAGVPLLYTNVFWGGRSEIKPSEVSPVVYEQWCRTMDLDPQALRE
jgi:DNA-binding Lrp family transcriptional regulator